MADANISADLRQMSHGQLKGREFNRYDINGYRFRTTSLEVNRPLAATSNSGVLLTAAEGSGEVNNYYGVLQKIIEYTFGGPKELKLVFFDCQWFDPKSGTRVDDFGMVDVNHNSRYTAHNNNVVLAHQVEQVYYLSYPHPSLKNWWVVYKVNREVHPQRFDEYVENHEDDDDVGVYQEEVDDEYVENHENFRISSGTGLAEIASGTLELMSEEQEVGPSRKRTRQSQRIIEKQQRIIEEQEIFEEESEGEEIEEDVVQEEMEELERREQRVAEADSDADDF